MPANELSSAYPALVEHLLAARVVCADSTPDLHQLLIEDDTGSPSAERQSVEALLATLGRRLAETEGVFYAALHRLDTQHAERSIEAAFDRYAQQARFIGEMVEIIREAQQAPEALSAGDRIRFPSLLDAIVSASSLRDRLMSIVPSISNVRKDLTPDRALRIAIKEMGDQGYLVNPSFDDQVYVLTGEIVLFHAFRDFVSEVEGLMPQDDLEDEPGAEQERLELDS